MSKAPPLQSFTVPVGVVIPVIIAQQWRIADLDFLAELAAHPSGGYHWCSVCKTMVRQCNFLGVKSGRIVDHPAMRTIVFTCCGCDHNLIVTQYRDYAFNAQGLVDHIFSRMRLYAEFKAQERKQVDSDS